MSCPICARDTDTRYKPFCSKRCADVDLAKWLGGFYAIASSSQDDAEDAADALERMIEEAAQSGAEKLH